MIVKSHRLSSFALLTECQGSVVPAIMPKIILATFIGILAKLIADGLWLPPNDDSDTNNAVRRYVDFSFTPFAALGVAISLFLGFHNNASYLRWWEARTLWGNQIIAVRDLSRFLIGSLLCHDGAAANNNNKKNKSTNNNKQRQKRQQDNNNNNRSWKTLEEFTTDGDDAEQANGVSANLDVHDDDGDNDEVQEDDEDDDWRHQIMILSIAQTHALRYQLRPYCRTDAVSAIIDRDRFLSPAQQQIVDSKNNGADAILICMAGIVGRQYQMGAIDSFVMVQLSQYIDRICHIQTGCERIHNTSLPFAYSLLVHRTAFLFVSLAPFAIVDSMGWYTPIFTAILAYTFFGLDELARQIQEPFRDEPHCLALSAMCRTIERDVYDALGRSAIPPPLKPHRSVLM